MHDRKPVHNLFPSTTAVWRLRGGSVCAGPGPCDHRASPAARADAFDDHVLRVFSATPQPNGEDPVELRSYGGCKSAAPNNVVLFQINGLSYDPDVVNFTRPRLPYPRS